MHAHSAEAGIQAVSSLRFIPLLPLLGALMHLLGGGRAPRKMVNAVACGVVGISFLVAVNAFLGLLAAPTGTALVDSVYTWFAVGGLEVPVNLRLDPLSGAMCLVVTGVGFLIHLYSAGYMSHDEDYARFFTYLNLFTAAMLTLLLADNLVLMFVGWEGVGLCSYLLIGFWYQDDEKATAGKKAFLVNRVGDFGFLLGTLLLFWTMFEAGVPSVAFADLNAHAADLPSGPVLAAALLLFVGATGKSAQVPLYVWLPDAMAGPTPVSALIHAATMVTAGVYMVARLNGVYLAAPEAMNVIAVIGAITALGAATVGVAQNDIKKVLAYSTVSQLGYMFLALGVGAFGAAIFHVITHAFFKALLFLGAGSVIHGMHEEQDIRKMGGLRHHMPVTYWTFLAGTLAIAGVPGLAGFFSKDEILASVWDHGSYGLWAVGVFGAMLTAFYMTRLLVLTFFGEFRGGEEAESRVHESPTVMTAPLCVLAFFAVVGGYMGVPHVLGGHNMFGGFLEPVVGHHELHIGVTTEVSLMLASVGAGALGILMAWLLYSSRGPEGDEALSGPLRGAYTAMRGAYHVDDFYNVAIVQPLLGTARWVWGVLDATLIDGVANGTATAATWLGESWRMWTTGNVRHYMLTVLLGATALLIAVSLTLGV